MQGVEAGHRKIEGEEGRGGDVLAGGAPQAGSPGRSSLRGLDCFASLAMTADNLEVV